MQQNSYIVKFESPNITFWAQI